jgi:hypothetical protein
MNVGEALGGAVCPLCGYDDYLLVTIDTGIELGITCDHGGKGKPRQWTQRRHHAPLRLPRSGLGEELGLYDDLQEILVVGEPYLEYGIVEHRYAAHNPAAYADLVGRYSHTRFGPTRYSASVFIGRALWTLHREGVLDRMDGLATGYWDYNHRLSAWARPPVPEDAGVVTWAEFAEMQGFDPKDWPALGYIAADRETW